MCACVCVRKESKRKRERVIIPTPLCRTGWWSLTSGCQGQRNSNSRERLQLTRAPETDTNNARNKTAAPQSRPTSYYLPQSTVSRQRETEFPRQPRLPGTTYRNRSRVGDLCQIWTQRCWLGWELILPIPVPQTPVPIPAVRVHRTCSIGVSVCLYCRRPIVPWSHD